MEFKTLTLNVIKKNRKYFKATHNEYPCKILVNTDSENLELGEQELLLNDISVHSKYGTDLIYSLAASAEEQAEDKGICTLKSTSYNLDLVTRCKELGGKWDRDASVWVFSHMVEDKVEELDYLYNSDLKCVELYFEDRECAGTSPYTYKGFVLATAYGRDSGAELGAGVALVEGRIDSGGSMKNWNTVIHSGTRIRLEIPKLLLTEDENKELAENGFIAI